MREERRRQNKTADGEAGGVAAVKIARQKARLVAAAAAVCL